MKQSELILKVSAICMLLMMISGLGLLWPGLSHGEDIEEELIAAPPSSSPAVTPDMEIEDYYQVSRVYRDWAKYMIGQGAEFQAGMILKRAEKYVPKGSQDETALKLMLSNRSAMHEMWRLQWPDRASVDRSDKEKSYSIPPSGMAYRPDGKQLAIGGLRWVELRDADTGQVSASFTTELARVRFIKFSKDGKFLLVADGRDIEYWSVEKQERLYKARVSSKVERAEFSHNGRMMALAPRSGKAGLYKVSDGRLLTALHRQSTNIYDLKFNSDDSRVVAIGDKQMVSWKTGGNTATSTRQFKDYIFGAAFVPDHQSMYWVTRYDIRLVNMKGELIRIIAGRKDGVDYTFSDDLSTLVRRNQDNTLTLYHLNLFTEVSLPFEGQDLYGFAIDAKAEKFAVSSTYEMLQAWSIKKKGKLIHQKHYKTPPGGYFMDAKGQWILRTGEFTNWMYRYDLNDGKELSHFKTKLRAVERIGQLPDGKTLVIHTDRNKVIMFWDLETNTLIREVKTEIPPSVFQKMSPDGKHWFVAGQGGVLYHVNTDTGETIKELKTPRNVRGIAISTDQKTLYVGTNGGKWYPGTIHRFNIETGEELEPLVVEMPGVTRLAISPDGKTLVAGMNTGALGFWNLETGTKLREVKAHDRFVTALQFTKNGTQIFTADYEGYIKLWTAEGEALYAQKIGKRIDSASISEDGKRVAYYENDRHTIRVWEIEDVKLPDYGAYLNSGAYQIDGLKIYPGLKKLAGDQPLLMEYSAYQK